MVSWYARTSLHLGSLLLPALILALIALPLLRTSWLFRPLLFSWTALVAAESAMLLFRDAGAGPHHIVLLYPAPHFIVAATVWASVERIPRLWPALAIMSVLFAANLWLLHGYYEAGRKNGFSVFWTDGVANLAKAVTAAHLPVAILDWGIQSTLQVATRGTVQMVAAAPIRADVLYVAHCEGYLIEESRYKPYQHLLHQERVVRDRHGAPLFCLFEMQR